MFSRKRPLIEEFEYNGHRYKIRGYSYNDDILKRIRKHHTFYELEILEFIRSEKLEGTYIDIGANIGNHTVFFANECPASSVIAFECYDKTFEILQQNCRENICTECDISLNNIAITESSSVFVKPCGEANIGKTSIVYEQEAGLSGVNSSSLDAFATGINDITFIKIDVEGNELDVLKSAAEVIRNHKPAMLIESMWNNFVEVNDIMYDSGYKLKKRFKSDPNLYYYMSSLNN